MNRTARLAALVLACVAGIARAAEAPANFVTWRPGLQSAAQPKAEWLAQARAKGYELVINLAPPQSAGSLRDEGGIVAAQGVVYVNIPVDFAHPTAEDFRVFSELLRSNAGKRILVHCQANLRGSAFVFLHRVIYEGASFSDAARRMNGVWAPNAAWKRFIEATLAAHGRPGELL